MVWGTTAIIFLYHKTRETPQGFSHYFSLTVAPVVVDVIFWLIKRLSLTLPSTISVILRFCYSGNMSVVTSSAVGLRPIVMNDFYQTANQNSQSLFEGSLKSAVTISVKCYELLWQLSCCVCDFITRRYKSLYFKIRLTHWTDRV